MNIMKSRRKGGVVAPANRNLEHPLSIMTDFFRRHSEIVEAELSLYTYEPQTVEDQRAIHKINPQRIACEYTRLESLLRPDQEIAFHSRVLVRHRLNTRVFHLPMIDFGDTLDGADIDRLIELALDFGCEEFDTFFSGRSFHFYGLTLLSQPQWIKFMGRILLLNMPGRSNVVDSRWVGHRLMAGYSSLRWSCNTTHYKQPPRFDRVWEKGDAGAKQKRSRELAGI